MAKQELIRRRWDRRAAHYDTALDLRVERWAIGDSRDWLCAQARGQTLEVAIGTGRNLELYRGDAQLTGMDISPGMLAEARRKAEQWGRPVRLVDGDAMDLPFPDATFDTVICTLAVCSVSDRGAAIAEMYRVLRPGGLLLLVDHLERRWLRGRPAELAIRRGFVPERRQRLRLGLIERLAARKPTTPAGPPRS